MAQADQRSTFWTPAVVKAVKILLDRCEPHGNLKPCVHCNYVAPDEKQE